MCIRDRINIDHQLQKKSKIGYYIQETKTTSGTRKIPMTADVEMCIRDRGSILYLQIAECALKIDIS